MKVAVITINYGYNYGNRLQCYAINHLLMERGIKVENLKKEQDISIVVKLKLFIKSKLRISMNGYEKRIINFNQFNDKYLTIKNIYRHIQQGTIALLNDKYDCFICGSDQIWNPYFGFNSDIEYLSFVKDKKKIALSASFGVDDVGKENEEHIAKMLKEIDYISVREEKAKEIVERITNKQVTLVCDPTFVLSKSDWIGIERRPKFVGNDKFLLCYLLEEYDSELMDKIDRLAKKNNLRIYYMEDEYKKLGKANIKEYSLGPAEFIWMIRNSELVVTDSFHAVAFSIIFGRKFKVIRRNNLMNMSSRMNTIVKKFKIEKAYFNGNDIEEETVMDFDYIEKRIKLEKQLFLEFLKNSLEN